MRLRPFVRNYSSMSFNYNTQKNGRSKQTKNNFDI